MDLRNQLIVAGFAFMGATRLHRIAAPITRGLGAILTLHHIRPAQDRTFAPNRALEITPEFLDSIIKRLRALNYDIVSMDDAVAYIAGERSPGRRPFAALTFDDGFRDNLEHALPVLERNDAPAIFYIPSGFPDRAARIWWVELETVIRKADRITINVAGTHFDLPTTTPAQKTAAFGAIYWHLRRGTEEQLLATIGTLCEMHGIDPLGLVEAQCLDWDGVKELASHPLATIGAHTIGHTMLAKHDEDRARRELVGGKRALEERLGRPVRHFAFPVGDPSAARIRDFGLAGEAGYASAVTTRPGLIFDDHRERLTCLPRVSVNGAHQTIRDFDILLSGVAFTLWNKGRRVPPL